MTEEAGGPSAVPTPRFGPLAADTSTEALSLPPPEAAITVTAASTATVSAATVPAGVATSLLKPSATPPVVRQGVVRATESAIVATAPLPAGSISPPQGRIVFPAYSAARKNWDLYIADTKGGGRTLVREQASLPAFAPGFSQLAFRSLHPSFLGLGLLQMGSSDFVQLTRYAEDARPSWSRDVPTLLVFDSQRQSDRRWRLYGVVADATTEWEMAVDNKPVYGQFPAWVPGGRLIYSGCVNGQCGLILADGDGSSPRAITSSPNDTAPVVSPDGQWVAFLSYDRPNGDLYATNMATGVKVALVQSDSNVGAPAWSPDGRYIGFVSNRGGQTAVWAVPFQGEQSQVLVPIKLFDLTELPPEGWPWLAQGIAWGQ